MRPAAVVWRAVSGSLGRWHGYAAGGAFVAVVAGVARLEGLTLAGWVAAVSFLAGFGLVGGRNRRGQLTTR